MGTEYTQEGQPGTSGTRAPPLFCSLFAYSYAKAVGPEEWPRVLEQELANLDASEVPGFRTLGAAKSLGPMTAYVSGHTLITKGRSVAAGEFLRSSADVWLSVDDDVFAPTGTVERLLRAARVTRSLVGAPCILRDGSGINAWYDKLDAKRIVQREGLSLYPVDAIGFGVVAIHRELVEMLAKYAKQVTRVAVPFPALFLEDVHEGSWIGEDFNFCHRARVGHNSPVYALLDAPTEHAGHWCRLDDDLSLQVRDQRTATLLKAGRQVREAQSSQASPSPGSDASR